MGLLSEDTSPCVKIHLDQESYAPGQLLKGYIRLTLVKSYRFTEVSVNFKGFRQSQHRSALGSTGHTTTQNEKKTYFRHITSLYRQADLEEKLPVGEHMFPFSFTLPLELPDSFEAGNPIGDYARIRYKVKLKITNPDLFRQTINESVNFAILSPFVQQYIPVELASDSEISNWLCCGSLGTVHWSVHLPKSYWRAGEVLEIAVSVDNEECQVPIHGLHAELRGLMVVTPKDEKAKLAGILEQLQLDRFIDVGKKDTFTVKMPLSKEALPTTEVDVFTCTYKLVVRLKMPRTLDPEIEVPIRICQAKAETTSKLPLGAASPPTTPLGHLHTTPVFADDKKSPPAYSHPLGHRT